MHTRRYHATDVDHDNLNALHDQLGTVAVCVDDDCDLVHVVVYNADHPDNAPDNGDNGDTDDYDHGAFVLDKLKHDPDWVARHVTEPVHHRAPVDLDERIEQLDHLLQFDT